METFYKRLKLESYLRFLTVVLFTLAFGFVARSQMPTISLTGLDNICPTASTTLSVNHTAGGTSPWTITYLAGTTTVTITGVTSWPHAFSVTPGVTTTYSLIDVTGGGTWTSTSSTSVTVLTAVASLTTNSPLCQGANLNLTSTPYGVGTTHTIVGPNSYYYTQVNPVSVVTLNSVSTAEAGTYTLTVVNTNGCTAVSSASVVISPTSVGGTLTPSTTAICSGQTVTMTLSGYTGTINKWQYWDGSSWNDVTHTSDSYTTPALTANRSYRVEVQSGVCSVAYSSTTTITVNALPTPSITASGNTTFCQGGSVDLVASGGTSYVWSSGPTTASITVSTSGTYTVTVTDANSCTASTSTVVTVNPLPTASITASDVTTFCQGGTVTLTASGGTSYLWAPGSQTSTAINVSASGTYTVTVTDANSCSASTSTVVTVDPTSVGGTLSPTTASVCTGTNSTTLTLSGNTGNVQKWEVSTDAGGTWTDVVSTSTSYTATNLTTGSYLYRAVVKSGTCATANSSVATITVNALPTPSITSTSGVTVCDGPVDLSVGTFSSTVWSGPGTFSATTATINLANNPANNGTYTVTVTDANGCTASTSTVVTIYALPTGGTLTPTVSAICQMTGSVTLTLTGSSGTIGNWETQFNGLGPWTSVQSGGSTYTLTNASTPGYYLVRVGISNGTCTPTTSGTATVTINATPTATITPGGPTTFCDGGSVVLTASAGDSWSWSTGATTQSITVTTSGSYTVTVTTLGCSGTSTPTTVTVNPNPAAALTTNSPLCEGATLILTAYPQVANMRYNWFGPPAYLDQKDYPSVTSAITAVSSVNAGTYTLVVTNLTTMCTSTTTTNVVISTPSVGGSITPATASVCNPNGSTLLTLSGHTGSVVKWQYTTDGTNWTDIANATTTYTVTGLTVNTTYRAVVQNGVCTAANSATATFTITAQPTASISYAGSPYCSTASPATVTLSGTNAYTGGTYSSSSLAGFLDAVTGTVTITSAPSGTHTVTYTLAASGGCATVTASTTLTITPPILPFTFNYSGTPYCPSVGTATPTNTSWVVGTYTATPAGCSINSSTGAIDLVASTAGTYTVTYTIAPVGGCATITQSTSVEIKANPQPTLTTNSPVCLGGQLDLTGSSGTTITTWAFTGPASFSAIGPVNVATLSPVGFANAGTYTLTVFAANGCSASTSTEVVVSPTTVGGTLTATATSLCTGVGSSMLTLSGHTGAILEWQSSSDGSSWGTYSTTTSSSITVSNLTSTTYYRVKVQSAGCLVQYSTSVMITVNPFPVPVITPSGPTTFCDGSSVDLTASGAGIGGSYFWTPGSSASPTINVTTSGTYTVTVTNAAGCSASTSTVVTVNPIPIVSITASAVSPVCATSSVILTANAGTFPTPVTYTYLWSTLATTKSITVTSSSFGSGTYTVTVTSLGCEASTSTVVTFTPLPTATISYAADPYCSNEGTASVTLNGTGAYTGGTYTSTTGLDLNTSSGDVTLASTTPGTYTVTYIVPASGGCPEVYAYTPITVTALPVISTFNYGSPAVYCSNLGTVNPTLVATGPAGTYAATPAGLSLNSTTGAVTLGTSAEGTYTVKYEIAASGGCGVVSATTTIQVKAAPAATATNDGPVCVGGTITLTGGPATGVSTYEWVGPPSFYSSSPVNVISLSPMALVNGGTYTLTVTGINGCTAVATTLVIVNPATEGGTLSGGTAVCAGTNSTTLTLSGNVGGVVRYEQSTDGTSWTTAATTTATTYTAVNLTQTTYFRAVVLNIGCLAAYSSTATITVTQLPTASIVYNGNPFCSNSAPVSVTLTGTNGYTGGTYSYAGTGTLSLNTATGAVTITTSTTGTYEVIYTIAAAGGCPAVTATTTITITPLPTASFSYPDSPYCPVEATAVPSVSVTGATNGYSFSAPGGLSINSSTGVVNLLASTAGTYTVTLSVHATGGCATITAQAGIIVHPNASPVATSNAPVCTGGTLILTGTSPISITQYSWVGPGSFTSVGTVNQVQLTPVTYPTHQGTFTLTVTDFNGCTAVTSTYVEISQLTVGGTLNGTTAVCAGTNSTVLTLTGQLGVVQRWESSPDGSTWATASTSSATTYTATNLTTTTHYRAVVKNGGCGEANSTIATITVNPIPVPVITPSGPTTFCAGGSVNLTASGGTSYLWSPGSQTATTITVNTSGTYTVTVTSLGCSSSTSVDVTVNPIPPAVITPSGPTTFCAGDNVVLTANSGTGYTYNWMPGGFTTQSITVTTSGTYTLTVTSLNCSSSTSVNVTVVPVNYAVISYAGNPFCTNAASPAPVTISSASGSAGTFSIDPVSGLAINSTTGALTISGSTAGTYNVIYTISAGTCPAFTTSTTVTVTQLPTASFYYAGTPYCSNVTDPAPVFTGTTGGVYSAPAGLSINSATGVVDLSASTPGTYTVTYTIAAAGGCGVVTATAPIEVKLAPAPTLTSNSPICTGGVLTLVGAPATGITLYTFVGPASFSSSGTVNTATLSPVTYPTHMGTYTLTVTGLNGCTAVTSTYVEISQPTVGGSTSGATTICSGNSATITLSGHLGTVQEWQKSSDNVNWSTATVTTAITYTPMNIMASTYYRAVVKNGGCGTEYSTSTLITVTPPPTATIQYAGSPYCSTSAPATVSLTGSTGGTFSASPSGLALNATTGTVTVTSSTPGSYVVTYNIAAAGGCPAFTTTTTIVITALPTASLNYGGTPNYCQSVGSVNPVLSGTGAYTGGTYTSAAGLSINASTGVINLTASTPGAYTVTYTIAAAGGCGIVTATAPITVRQTPVATATTNSPVCTGGTLILTGGANLPVVLYSWTGPASFSSVGTVNVVTLTPVTNPTHQGYYNLTVTADNGCTASTSTYVEVSVPSVGGTLAGTTTICAGQSATLTLSGQTGAVVRWESSLNGTTWTTASTSTATTYTANNLTQTTHFRAVVKNGGCSEVYSSVAIVTVNPIPVAVITPSGPTTFCAGGSVNLTASGGTSYLWSPGGQTATTITVNSSGTYTVEVTSLGCSSTTSVTVTVNPIPPASITPSGPTTFCAGSLVILTANSGTGYTYMWSTGATTQSITVSTSGTYTVTITSNNCSNSASQVVTVVPVNNATISYAGSPFCSNATGTANVTMSGTTGGTYSIVPSTGLPINSTTGQLTLTSATVGSYTVHYTIPAGTCPAFTTSTTVTVTQLPSASFSYPGTPYCTNMGNATPTFTGTTGGVFASTTGLSLNATTGVVDLGATTPGTYTVTYTIAAAGGCPAVVTSASIVIRQAPVPTATSNSPVCDGGTLILTGTPTTGITLYSWSGPGSFSSVGTVNTASLSPVTYPTHQGWYYLTVTGLNGCTATTSTWVEISLPTVGGTTAGSTTICAGGSATISLSGQTGIVQRWEKSTDGGANWTTAATTSATSYTANNVLVTTQYRAVVKNGGCGEANSTVSTITITAAPSATIAYLGSPYCSNGTTAVVTLTGTSGGTFSAPAGLAINATTGTVTLGSSTPGSYVVTYYIAAGGGCSAFTTTTTITITPLPTASITYGTTPSFCSNTGTVSPTLNGTGAYTGGTYSAPAGLSINPGTGVVTLGTSTPGTYTVTYTIAAANGCAAVYAYAPITVREAPVPVATSNSPVCDGGTLTLTGTPTTGITLYNWTGPGSFSSVGTINTAILSPVTYPTHQGTYYLTVTATNLCTATTSTYVEISLPTVGGTLNGTSTICSGSNAVMTLTGQLGTVQRYESSLNGTTWTTAATTSATTYTATGLTQTTMFRAVVKNGGCGEAYSTVATITVTPQPVVSLAYTGNPYCTNGGTAVPTITQSNTSGTGTFTSAPAGLMINSSTGVITLASSAPGTYTVTYTTNGVAGCSGMFVSASTLVTVNEAPSATIYYLNGPVFCSNAGTATMVLTGTTGGIYSSTAGLSINPTTGNVNLGLSTAGTYTVTYTIAAANGCAQYTTTTNITITQLPAATIAYTGSPYCSNGGTASVTRTGTAGGTYSAPAGLVINSSTGAVTLGTSTPGTYTVTYTMPAAGSCPVQYAYASITITQLPAASFSYPASPYCSNLGIITPVFSGTTGGVFSAPAGLSINSSTGAVNLGLSTAGTYNVTYTIAAAGGCAVVTATAPITILLAPAPVVTSNSPICTGGTLTLTGTPTTGITLYEFWGPGGFSSVGTVNTAILSPVTAVNNGTYYLRVTGLNGCTATTSTDVVISPVSVGGSVYPPYATVCVAPNSTQLTLSGQTGNVVRWEQSIDGGINWTTAATTSATTYTATNLTVTTQFRAVVATGGCPEAYSSASIITVTPIPTANIVYTGTPYCSNGGTATVTLTGTPGGVFSSTTGLSIIPQTGAVNLGLSTPGSYTVTYYLAPGGGCPAVYAYAPITITQLPAATISYGTTPEFCTNSGVATPSMTGTTGGTYSAPAGLTINSGTGVVTLATSTPGTYTVTYTIAAANGCGPVYAYAPIIIKAAPVPTATSNSPVCVGGTLILTGTPATGISNYEWVGPGFYSTGSVNTASLTPMGTGNAGTYYLTVTATNGCTAVTTTEVSIAPTTVGGTVASNQTLCSGSVPADLTLSGYVGNILYWQKSASPAFTSPVNIPVTTPVLPGSTIGPLTSTTFFRAVVQSGTCAPANSSSAAIVVNPLPAAPGVTVANNCGNSVLTATGYTGTLLWSNGATTPSITVTVAGTYTVVQTVAGCVSAPGSGTAAPKVIPNAPTITVVNNCGNSVLTASNYTGTLLWSTGETTPSITVTVGGSYTVNQTVNGCVSPNASALAEPKAIPTAPVVNVSNECGYTVLTATGYTGTLLWSTGATTPSINVTVAGTYTVNQTVNGCVSPDGTGVADPKVVPTAPTVTVVNYLGYSVLTASNYTGTLLWSNGATTASINVTVAGTYNVTQTVNGCVSLAGSGTAAPIATATFAGYVKYKNAYTTPMNGVLVTLTNLNTSQSWTTLTSPMSGNGYYQFTGMPAGTYKLTASYNGTWGGNNATDALRVKQTVVGINPLTGLNLLAGDVNASGLPLTALDALMIENRTVGYITSYPAGDWIFEEITFTPTGNVNQTIYGLCFGDVDGSYIPTGMKAASYLDAVDDDVMNVLVNQPFTYELKANTIAELGAMTLFMNYDAATFSIDKVNTPIEGMKVNVTEGRIALAWANTTPLSTMNDQTVISFQVTLKRNLNEPTDVFMINGGSEFADPQAIRIENFELKMAKVITPAASSEFFLYNYPNPFRNNTEIVYSIPEDGKVKLILTNLYGQAIRTLVDTEQAAGMYKVKVDPSDGYMAPGVYLYRIEVEGATGNLTKTNKMLLTR